MPSPQVIHRFMEIRRVQVSRTSTFDGTETGMRVEHRAVAPTNEYMLITRSENWQDKSTTSSPKQRLPPGQELRNTIGFG